MIILLEIWQPFCFSLQHFINYITPCGCALCMREMSIPAAILIVMGLGESVSMITDGTYSGATRGPCIGHVFPEAIEVGSIAVVKNDDLIEIDIDKRKLNILIPEEVL
jgi:dihydroxy-acid dehydratase